MIRTNYKYAQLTEILRGEILDGRFADGRFPTVKAMMERFSVSQATLTKALQPLYDANLIYSISGKGTFVSKDLESLTEPKAPIPTIYCIAAHEEMFDPARTSPDWCFTQLMLKGVLTAAKRHKIMVNITPVASDFDTFRSLADQPGAMFIFLCYATCEQQVEYVIQKQIPYSLYINDPISRNLNLVFCDVSQAMEDVTDYLIEQGHRNIAFLGGHNGSARHRGYCRALRRHGIPHMGQYDWLIPRGLPDQAQAMAADKLREHPEVTAIAAATDFRAIGAWRAADALPEKRAIASIDNMWKYYHFSPPLTTIDMHLPKAGETLLEILLEKANDGQNRQRTIAHTLHKGETA